MKRRALIALARSLGEYLASRNHDITGYWGIGMLCAAAKVERREHYTFRIRPGEMLRIGSREVTGSRAVTDKLVKFELDTIEGRLTFLPDGRFPDGTERFTCIIAIAISQAGRTGLSVGHVHCWPHDGLRESRRADAADAGARLFRRLMDLLP